MNIHTCLKTALALLAFSATSAMAVPLKLEADIGGYLSEGKHRGSFDGTSLLPKNFFINSLQFSFVFMDDGDIVEYKPGTSTISAPVTVREEINSKTFKETITKTVTSPRFGLGEREAVTLNFGALSLYGETLAIDTPAALVPSGQSNSTQVLFQKSGGTASCSAADWALSTDSCQKITRTTTTFYQTSIASTDYTGFVLFDGSLMAYEPLLHDLMLNRKLDFSFEVLGDLDLIGATLEIDYGVRLLANPSEVPEPGSLVLFEIALMGMAGVRRKQRA